MTTWLKSTKLYKNYNWWRNWVRTISQSRRGSHLFQRYRAKDSTLSGLWFTETLLTDRALLVSMLTHARQVLTDLGHVFSDAPFTITFWAGPPAITDVGSNRIFIDARLFLVSPAALTDRVDVAGGLVIHELSHVEFSDPAYLRRAHERSRIFYLVWGTIEDERIERLAIQRSPGFADLLRKTRRFYLTPSSDEIISLSEQAWEQLLGTVFLAIRNPLAISNATRKRFEEELKFVVRVLSPYPVTAQDAYQAAERIVDHLFKERESEEQKEREASEHGGGATGDGSGSPEETPPTPLEERLESLLGHGAPLSTSIPPALTEALSDLDKAGAKEHPRYGTKVTSGGFGTPPTSELDLSGPIFFQDTPEDATAYATALSSVRPLILPLRKYFQYHTTKRRKLLIRGTSAGHLSGRILHRISSTTNLFSQTRHQVNKQKIVVLLIDQSGSMGDRKIAQAQRAAIAIKEAVKTCSDIKMFIFGHAADMPPFGDKSTVIFRYDTPSHPNTKRLGSISLGINNRDGVAIAAVAEEVEIESVKYSNNPEKIMIIISDGAPAATAYGGEASIKHTKSVVEALESRGWKIIEVAIPPHDDAEQMFSHVISLQKIEDLPIELGKLLRQTISL